MNNLYAIMRNYTVKFLPAIAIVCAIALIVLLIVVVNNQRSFLIVELVVNPVEESMQDVQAQFKPVETQLKEAREQIKSDPRLITVSMDVRRVVRRFSSLVLLGNISSLGIADTTGQEINLTRSGNLILSRHVVKDSVIWSVWKRDETGQWQQEKRVSKPGNIDPRNRPWYTGTIAIGTDEVFVTDPYEFNTTGEPGITMSTRVLDSLNHFNGVLAFDLTIDYLSELLKRNRSHDESKIFILDQDTMLLAQSDGDAVGAMRDKPINADSKGKVLDWLDACMANWLSNPMGQEHFSYDHAGVSQIGLVTSLSFGGKENLFIGSVIPELALFSQLNQTKRIIILSSLGIFLLMVLSLRANQLRGRYFNQLRKITAESRSMSHALREKNQEIHKSMVYAKQIQGAIMSKSTTLFSAFPKSFVIHTPLEVVGGDFFWVAKKADTKVFALADCTGHGIPSALISMLGAQAFQKSVHELDESDPAEILNTVSKMIIDSFSSESQPLPDGMDVSVITIKELKKGEISVTWAGANSNIWIIRKYRSPKDEYTFEQNNVLKNVYPTETGLMIELKSGNSSIGSVAPETPFINQQINLKTGDLLYMFSDGIVDQFGGEQGKKLKVKYFREKMLELSEMPLEMQEKRLKAFLATWKGSHSQTDDMTFVALEL